MSSNIDVQVTVDDKYVIVTATNLLTGDQATRRESYNSIDSNSLFSLDKAKATATKYAIEAVIVKVNANTQLSDFDQGKTTNVNINYKGFFPNEAYNALTKEEKQDWSLWLHTASPEAQNELVKILHSMWETFNNRTIEIAPKHKAAQPKKPSTQSNTNTSSSTRPKYQSPTPVPTKAATTAPRKPQLQKPIQSQPKSNSLGWLTSAISVVLYGIGFVASMATWIGFLNYLFFGTIALVIVIVVVQAIDN